MRGSPVGPLKSGGTHFCDAPELVGDDEIGVSMEFGNEGRAVSIFLSPFLEAILLSVGVVLLENFGIN